MQGILNNEFTSSPDNNSVRPYTTGMTRHQETLSTILVYNEDTVTLETNKKVSDYTKLDTVVKSITPGAMIESASGLNNQGKSAVGYESFQNLKLDGTNNYYGVFNNFSLLNVQEMTEQIVKTHINFSSKWNAFFFGEKPRVYSYTGIFLDTMDYPYFQEFSVAYDKYLSGRKAVENKIRTKLVYDGRIVDGYMLNLRTVTTAARQQIKEFAFTMLIKDVQWVRTNLIPTLQAGNSRTVIEHEVYNGLSNAQRLKRFFAANGVAPESATVQEQPATRNN